MATINGENNSLNGDNNSLNGENNSLNGYSKKIADLSTIKFDKFELDISIHRYFSQWEASFRLKNVSPSECQYKDIFLTFFGNKNIELVDRFCYPDSIETLSFKEIKSICFKLFKPTSTAFASRFDFVRLRRTTETITEFADKIRTIGKRCHYLNDIDERLRDQFMVGMEIPGLERDLRALYPDGLDRDNNVLTFQFILDLALASERADKEMANKNMPVVNKINVNNKRNDNDNYKHPIKTTTTIDKGYNKVKYNNTFDKENNNYKYNNDKDYNKLKCYKCGFIHNREVRCPATNAACNKCKKIGHFAVCCKSKNLNYIRVSSSDSIHNIWKIQQNRENRAKLTAEINGLDVEFDFDTGAQASLIGIDIWTSIGRPKIRPTSPLTAYGDHPLDVKGETQVNVRIGSQTRTLPVVIMNTTGVPLFGLP
ncbi:unnamed protein product [Gordionus sp. m RMFG-2023]